jgi:hypothetical protein
MTQLGNAPPLLYNGQPMKFKPTRILCLQAQGPLDSDEPDDAEVCTLLLDGYAVFVELQPGDGTRYGLLLTTGFAADRKQTVGAGINVTRIGAIADGSLIVPFGKPPTPKDCIPLAPSNEWTQLFFAWWLTALLGERPAQ